MLWDVRLLKSETLASNCTILCCLISLYNKKEILL
uniref:Uncharacterized protein n=1 Tax=Arundo donax TaxID=35708 RepID=A0A0A9E4B3_ARUDO